MSGLLVVLALLAVAALLLHHKGNPPVEPDAEQVLKAATDLHKIRRRLDVAWSRTEMRAESARVRRDIAAAIKEEDG